MRTTLYILLPLLGISAIFFFYEKHSFNQWLESGHRAIQDTKGTIAQVNPADLPPLLQNYLRQVLIDNSTTHYVHFSQIGTFRMKPEDNMSPFTAEQFVSVVSPMFSWVAKIQMKGLGVAVCDRLVNGQGELQARLFSSIPLAKGSGDSFLRGELLRYMAELPWYPMAILNQSVITWQQSGKNKVKGTISINRVSATVEYTFNKEGFIESIFVPDREMTDGDQVEKAPWLGEFSKYEKRAGVVIPIEGRVSWLLDEGKFTYFKGEIAQYQTTPE